MRTPLALLCPALLVASSLAAGDLGVGKPAPALKVSRWIKGEPVPAFAKGQIYVVEFWATWCGPCKATIPHLTALAKQYEGKITFIGVNVWERGAGPALEARIDAFVAEMGDKMAYRVARDTGTDSMARSWMEAADQKGIPAAFIVDGNGTIAWIGFPNGPEFDKALEAMAAGTFDLAASRAAFEKAQADAKASEQTQQAIRVAMGKVSNSLAVAKRAKNPATMVKALDQALEKYPVLKQTNLPEMRMAARAHLEPEAVLAQFQELQGPSAQALAVALSREEGLKPAFYERVITLLKPGLPSQPIMNEHLARASHFAGQKAEAVAYQKALIAFAASRNAPKGVMEEFEKDLKTYEAGK